ncbi:MAG: hypothetical protein JWQ73_4389 [Variovorax sp.]|nr:hypothetical protein [Variovorax sp.]
MTGSSLLPLIDAAVKSALAVGREYLGALSRDVGNKSQSQAKLTRSLTMREGFNNYTQRKCQLNVFKKKLSVSKRHERCFFQSPEIAVSSSSIQCLTGTPLPLCRCVMQPMLAEATTLG